MANGNGKKSGAQLDREIDEVLAMRQKKAGTPTAPRPPARTGTPSQAEYERRELTEAQSKRAQGRCPRNLRARSILRQAPSLEVTEDSHEIRV